MDLILRTFPDVTPERIAVIVNELVKQRNFVSSLTRTFQRSRWGLGCLEYEEARLALFDLVVSGTHKWLGYKAEQGQAYTMMVGSTPIRIQSESDEFRPVMPNERLAMRNRRHGRLLPGLAQYYMRDALLRLEVYQRAGEPMKRVTLIMFDEASATQLDEWRVYERADAAAPPAPPAPSGNNVFDLRRDAETPEVSDPAFLDAESANDEEES